MPHCGKTCQDSLIFFKFHQKCGFRDDEIQRGCFSGQGCAQGATASGRSHHRKWQQPAGLLSECKLAAETG